MFGKPGKLIEAPETAGMGAEVAIAAMDDYDRYVIGKQTYNFVLSVRRNNPTLWAEIQRRAREMEASAG